MDVLPQKKQDHKDNAGKAGSDPLTEKLESPEISAHGIVLMLAAQRQPQGAFEIPD